MNNIGKKLKKQRLSIGLTQEELAKKLGYKSKTTINKIEAGINDIPRKKINDFAIALETSPEYFLECDSINTFISSSNENHITPTDMILTDEEEILLFYYRKLSKHGRKIAKERMKELTEIHKYVENRDN